MTIHRDPTAFANDDYDLVVVGGGIHGTALFLEAARRGLRVILLERDDFGGGTSWNSLRILHGGLRHLRYLDVASVRRSVAARRWFFRTYPTLVQPLPCLLPFSGRGVMRASAFRGLLGLENLLSVGRNRGVSPANSLPRSRVVTPRDASSRVAGLGLDARHGAALWHDGVVVDPPRLLLEMLRWGCSEGGRALNYTEVLTTETRASGLAGVVAVDRTDRKERVFNAPRVVFCVGPHPKIPAHVAPESRLALPPPSLAFNLVIRKRLPVSSALAVESMDPADEQIYFLHPRGKLTLAGTTHEPWDGDASVGARSIRRFTEKLQRALPGWGLSGTDVVRVLAGSLPVDAPGSRQTVRGDSIVRAGGEVDGLFAVVANKYTTAPVVATRALQKILAPGTLPERSTNPPPPVRVMPSTTELLSLLSSGGSEADRFVENLADEESVVQAEDFVLRRGDWGLDPTHALALASALAELGQPRLHSMPSRD